MPRDPYRYFRIEAHELLEGLEQGLMELEKGADQELVGRLLRQAHTFKGASRVVKRTDIGDLSHAIEDLLSPHRESGGPVEQPTIDRALEILERVRELVSALSAEPTGQRGAAGDAGSNLPPAEAERDREVVRVARRDLDALLEAAFEVRVAGAGLKGEVEELDRLGVRASLVLAKLRASPGPEQVSALVGEMDGLVRSLGAARLRLAERGERVALESNEVHAAALELRLIPAQQLVTELERVALAAARTLGRSVEVRASGSETEIDAHVLSALRKALVHLVRNSVAHGIEDEDTRRRLGKPATGRITIGFERRGQRVAVSCTDDGRGVDLESVRTSAVARGKLDPDTARAMDEGALGQVLLGGGVSTKSSVDEVSGRGLGLEAVRHVVDSLRGEISLRTRPGEETVVEMLVPLSLSAVPALALHVDGGVALLALDTVRRALRVSAADVSRGADGDRLLIDGEVVPFLPLERALGRAARRQEDRLSAVLIETEGRRAAIGVKRLGETRSVVVRAIPAHAAAEPVVAGAAMDEGGVPQIVVSSPVLVGMACSATPSRVEADEPSIPPLLVIDDSLTTRMLEQSILESAGYQVDLAVSAEEGLDKARQRRYGAFVVDVEMPGMSGFEFIETAQGDPELCDVPAILVTSRAEPADMRRGNEVGARAYIVKGDFDQTELLETIRRLVG